MKRRNKKFPTGKPRAASRRASDKTARFQGVEGQLDITRYLRAMATAGMPADRVEIEDGRRRITLRVNGAAHTGAAALPSIAGYLSIREACIYGKFGRTRAYELIADGTLKVKKFGKKTLVLKSSVDRMHRSLPRGLKHR